MEGPPSVWLPPARAPWALLCCAALFCMLLAMQCRFLAGQPPPANPCRVLFDLIKTACLYKAFDRFKKMRPLPLGCASQSIDRVSGLWDPAKDAQHPAAKLGAYLHVAKMAAYRAAGQHSQVRTGLGVLSWQPASARVCGSRNTDGVVCWTPFCSCEAVCAAGARGPCLQRRLSLYVNSEHTVNIFIRGLHKTPSLSSSSFFISPCPCDGQQQVLEYWEDLRGRMNPNALQQYWRLPFYATASAMSYGNLEAADRFVCFDFKRFERFELANGTCVISVPRPSRQFAELLPPHSPTQSAAGQPTEQPPPLCPPACPCAHHTARCHTTPHRTPPTPRPTPPTLGCRYALVFSDKVNGVAFRKEDYQWSIGPMFVQLVHKMAAAQMWDQAVYWLQQLLNHDVSGVGEGGCGTECWPAERWQRYRWGYTRRGLRQGPSFLPACRPVRPVCCGKCRALPEVPRVTAAPLW